MGVTIELQNLGDAQLCRDITAHLEHAFSGRQGKWRVSIAGSRAAENWDLRVEGPNGFERLLIQSDYRNTPSITRLLPNLNCRVVDRWSRVNGFLPLSNSAGIPWSGNSSVSASMPAVTECEGREGGVRF